MVFPLLAGAMIGSTALQGIYAVGKAYDNKRYWDAYYRNTGKRPEYPWFTGANDYFNYGATATKKFGYLGGWL